MTCAWIQGAFHEGLAASNRHWARVHDSVFIGNNQGVEAGYGAPDVSVTQSVIVRNRNRVDPASQVTAGIRFGDGYDGRNGDYRGHVSAAFVVVHGNGDNVRNHDGTIPGPQEGAVDVTHSLTNDTDVSDPSNLNGIPVFSHSMHLLRGSAGFDAGPEGTPLGRPVPVVTWNMSRVPLDGDFNDDGVVNSADVDQFCEQLQTATDPTFDLNHDGEIDETDRDILILDFLGSTYGDANLNGVFDAQDLVDVFIAGEYHDAVASNSTWSDGDWNCDGDFTSDDIVLAFRFGGYATSPAAKPQTTAVSKPSIRHTEMIAALAAHDDLVRKLAGR